MMATAARVVGPLRGIRGLLLLLGPLLAWEVLGSEISFSYPPPRTWWEAIQDMYSAGELLPAAGRTAATFGASLAVAAVVGVMGGVVIGASLRVERAVNPLLEFVRAVPPPAVVPVFGLLLGPTMLASVIIVVLAIVWPVLMNTVMGMRSIPLVRKEMSRSLGLGPVDRIRKVVLPSLAPHIMIGLRVSVSLSLIVTLFTDIVGAGEGLGRLLVEQQQLFEAASVWGLLALIGVGGYAVNAGFATVERVVFSRWPEDARPVG